MVFLVSPCFAVREKQASTGIVNSEALCPFITSKKFLGEKTFRAFSKQPITVGLGVNRRRLWNINGPYVPGSTFMQLRVCWCLEVREVCKSTTYSATEAMDGFVNKYEESESYT